MPTDAVGSAETAEVAPKEANAADVSPADAAAWQAQVDAIAPAGSSEVEAADAAPAEQIIERLVGEVLAAPDVSALNSAERAELEADLRANLANDPTLRALTEDIHRGT